jgi:hypothetical protein
MNREQWENKAGTIHNKIMEDVSNYNIWNDLHFSYTHIVWEDDNYLPRQLDWCLEECLLNKDKVDDYILAYLMKGLCELMELPEYKESWWEEDDYEN